MDTREALEVVESLNPRPVGTPPERNWPVSIIEAAAKAAEFEDGGGLVDPVMYDRLTEAVSVLVGIPYIELLSAAEVAAATPPLPHRLEHQGEGRA